MQRLSFNCNPCVVGALDAGDIWLTGDDGNLIVFERKTPGDLLASIADGRLHNQVHRMRELTPFVFIIITGTLVCSSDGMVIKDGIGTNWQWPAVQGALVTAQELGAVVAYCRDDDDYEHTVMRLANRKRGKELVAAPRIDSRLVTPGEAILSALPGIGMDKAQLILGDFDNCAALALPWLTHLKAVHKVYGVGIKTKERVRAALGIQCGHELNLTPIGHNNNE